MPLSFRRFLSQRKPYRCTVPHHNAAAFVILSVHRYCTSAHSPHLLNVKACIPNFHRCDVLNVSKTPAILLRLRVEPFPLFSPPGSSLCRNASLSVKYVVGWVRWEFGICHLSVFSPFQMGFEWSSSHLGSSNCEYRTLSTKKLKLCLVLLC